jgi:hypothetical protein
MFAEFLYPMLKHTWDVAKGGQSMASAKDSSDLVPGLLTTGSGILGAAGTLAGGTAPAASSVLWGTGQGGIGALLGASGGAAEALLGAGGAAGGTTSGLGAALTGGVGGAAAAGKLLLGASSVLHAGALGYGIGTFLDRRLGLSDFLSDAMTGDKEDRNDELILDGIIPTKRRGRPTDEDRLAAAARLPGLEARRQREIADLVRMARLPVTPMFRDHPSRLARDTLRTKHGIDLDQAQAANENAPRRQPLASMTPFSHFAE